MSHTLPSRSETLPQGQAAPQIQPSVPPRAPKHVRAVVPPPPRVPHLPAPKPCPVASRDKPEPEPQSVRRVPRPSVTAVKSAPRPSVSPGKPPVPGPKPVQAGPHPSVRLSSPPVPGPKPARALASPPLPARAPKPPPLPTRALRPAPLPKAALRPPPLPNIPLVGMPVPSPKVREVTPRRAHPSTLSPVSFDTGQHPIPERFRATLPPARPFADESRPPPQVPSPPAPAELAEHPPSLFRGFPSWVPSAAVALLTATVVGILGITFVAPDDDAVEARSFGRVAPLQAPAVVPLTELAAAGVQPAMREVENKPTSERTIDDVVALAQGRVAQRRDALAELQNELARDPMLGENPAVLRRLHAATEDPELARDALKILATLPGSKPADALYEVWAGKNRDPETTRLARDLLYVKSVREKASPALSVALDLRAGNLSCEEVSAVVDRALAHGDRRSLRSLGTLTNRSGCGPNNADDCYPCLRSGRRHWEAVSAVLKRPAPKL